MRGVTIKQILSKSVATVGKFQTVLLKPKNYNSFDCNLHQMTTKPPSQELLSHAVIEINWTHSSRSQIHSISTATKNNNNC